MLKEKCLYIPAIILTALPPNNAFATITPYIPETDTVFEYTDGNAENYSFSIPNVDASGNLSKAFYKITLKPELFSLLGTTNWTQITTPGTNSIKIEVLDNDLHYFDYTYTKPESYTLDTMGIRSITLSNLSASHYDYSYLYNNAASGDITAKLFSNNNIMVTYSNTSGSGKTLIVSGGALSNTSVLGNITADFSDNSIVISSSGSQYTATARGGAIYNTGTIGDIKGSFINNSVSALSAARGGAIGNAGSINFITGDFIANTAKIGGSIDNNSGIISAIKGNFIGNNATIGSAINNNLGTISSISGNFIGNATTSYGGAINNNNLIGNIEANFIGNYVYKSQSGNSSTGGAIHVESGTINKLVGDFIGNYVKTNRVMAIGGAIYVKTATIDEIRGNFIGNYTQVQDKDVTNLAIGGAINTNSDLTFVADGVSAYFSKNYTSDTRGKIYNAIFASYFAGKQVLLTFNTANGGTFILDDTIDGGLVTNLTIDNSKQYNIALTGDGTGTMYVTNSIINAKNVSVDNMTLRFRSYQHQDQTANNWDGKGNFTHRNGAQTTSLSLSNAAFDIANGYQDTVKLKNYNANNSFLHLDADVDNMTADVLDINGNVEGVTKLVLYPTSNKDIRGMGSILFAKSKNDTTGNARSFEVFRVYSSPYMFGVNYAQTDTNTNQWELEMNDTINPDEEKPEPEPTPDPDPQPTPDPDPQPAPITSANVAPEVIAYSALPTAALEQTRGMIDSVKGQIKSSRLYCPGCGFYDYYWNGEAFRNVWANASYRTSNYDAPFNIDADVWGLEAGADLQHDLNHKVGVFVSYRKGNYDMNGDGKHYYATIGSEIDIDSYLAGLYYRYDRGNWWGFATLYGGMQKADIKTKDGIKSDTDGTEFGGSAEAGYDFALSKTVYLTPSLGAFYTQVNFDDAQDSAGKIAQYNNLKQIELEAALKLTKAFYLDEGYANLYIKPGIVQTLVDGDDVHITRLGKVNTVDDQTLGRIELGARYGFMEQLSAYGWANYTFGDGYDAATFGAGLNYSF